LGDETGDAQVSVAQHLGQCETGRAFANLTIAGKEYDAWFHHLGIRVPD